MITLVGKKVNHKIFGIGIIQSVEKDHISVSFDQGNKQFVFPDAFKAAFLTAIDEETSSMIEEILKKSAPPAPQPPPVTTETYSPVKKKNYKKVKRENIAFKCNYCDGGKSREQVGFDGVCSDAIIRNNIHVEKRTWCSSVDSPCFQYFFGRIDREELECKMAADGFVCYESRMLRDWRASAGIIQNGINKGKPMRLNQVQANSLCVLTTRYPGYTENDRFIFAVFLVDETFEGDNKEEGFVSTESEFKINLTPAEASKMLFWKYHTNGNKPDEPAWNTGLHRYFDDNEAVQILRDIVNIKRGTKDEQLAVRFLEHFCRINGVNIDAVPEPKGALTRARWCNKFS